jgi:hypothetical protein
LRTWRGGRQQSYLSDLAAFVEADRRIDGQSEKRWWRHSEEFSSWSPTENASDVRTERVMKDSKRGQKA